MKPAWPIQGVFETEAGVEKWHRQIYRKLTPWQKEMNRVNSNSFWIESGFAEKQAFKTKEQRDPASVVETADVSKSNIGGFVWKALTGEEGASKLLLREVESTLTTEKW